MDAGRLIDREIVKTLYESDEDGTVYKGWTRQGIQHLNAGPYGNVFALVLAEYDDPGNYWSVVYSVGNEHAEDFLPWNREPFHPSWDQSLLVLTFPHGDGFRLFNNEDLEVAQ